ncbi:LysR family transcriptional regulator [Streptomyces silvisoli]|uniref:LysR family transcriptional regulator n=1 Tax=Streptomyces silvisoli TaxID=3034235 RepID=A0ABT5ZL41_9ACTN|nr:LysR family transcriptional regulator [Streptomyces silvisoli]MDF3289703.1 LysR family transcriptional regulator [Streptomyces silvisoli]
MEWSSTALRVLRTIAERGSFTAAAAALGYSQSAVSRQMAALERAADARLFERRPGGAGVRLTAAGVTLLRHASAALDEVDRAERIMHGAEPGGGSVRLGVFKSVGAAILPETLALMRGRRPDVQVVTREGSTPSLVRGLRATTLDLAVISSRPPHPAPDDQSPPLRLDVLLEGDLLVAVPARGELGRDGSVTLAELRDVTWISSTQAARGEPELGVWPALPQRPVVGHQAQDWLSKFALVAAGCGVTTLPPYLVGLLPDNVRVVRVREGAPVSRRVLLARPPGAQTDAAAELADCLREAAEHLPVG